MPEPTYTRVKIEVENLGITAGIDVDSSGNIYIANRKRDHVGLWRLAPDGHVEELPVSGLSDPYGVKIDPAGQILIANYGAHQIIRFDPVAETQEVLGFTGLRFPSDVEVGADGSVYVADSGNHRVVRLGVDGVQETLGSIKLWGVHGIALDSTGGVYITRMGSDTGLYKFGPNGEFTRLAMYGLGGPAGIDIGQDGIVYVANSGQDQYSSTVARFEPDGTRLAAIRTCEYLSGTPCVMRPVAIALDAANNIAVFGYQPEAIWLVRN